MNGLLVVLLLQLRVSEAPLDASFPPPELVGVAIADVERTLAQPPAEIRRDAEAVALCKYRCDEVRAYGSATSGTKLFLELRKEHVTRARWAFPGDGTRPKSYEKFSRAFAKKRIPEADLVWLGGFAEYEGEPPPKGWRYGVVGWPRWGRLTIAVVLLPAKGAPTTYRLVELLESDGRIIPRGFERAPLLAGGTAADLLRLHGEPAQVVPDRHARPISPCAAAACDGTWAYEPTCYRDEGLVCGMILAHVSGGRVLEARWAFDSEVSVWRLPLPLRVFASFPPESASLSVTPGEATYELPDGTAEASFRRLQWNEGDIEWTVDVACPPVPHGLGFRKPRVDEYRVMTVFQRVLGAPADP